MVLNIPKEAEARTNCLNQGEKNCKPRGRSQSLLPLPALQSPCSSSYWQNLKGAVAKLNCDLLSPRPNITEQSIQLYTENTVWR